MDKVDLWYLQRWAKFSSSENYKLLTAAKGNEVWSSGSLTYIETKAIEAVSDLWERPELEEIGSLLHGKVHEYPAFEAYINTTRNTSMTYMGSESPVFLEYELLKDESGGTPDVVNITKDNNIDFGAEIKCPKNPVYHFRRLKWKDQWDIKSNYPLVYCQMQHLLMITNASEWHFVSFDDRQKLKAKKIKIIPVTPDKRFQDNLHIKLEMAIKEKYKTISDHYEIDVKCKDDVDKYLKKQKGRNRMHRERN